MRRSVGLLLVGVCTFAALLLVTAPATLVDSALGQWSSGRMRLAEATGTVWSGAGTLEFLDARGRSGAQKPLAWRLHPASLLRGRAELEFSAGDAPFTISVFLSHVEASDVHLTLPAAALGLAVPNLTPLEPTGNVMLDAARLSMAERDVHGNATMQWTSAGSTVAPVSPLGDYELQLHAEGRVANAVLKTERGILMLDGRGSWNVGGPPAMVITARVQPQYRLVLQPLLRLIALDRGDGSFELNVSSITAAR